MDKIFKDWLESEMGYTEEEFEALSSIEQAALENAFDSYEQEEEQ